MQSEQPPIYTKTGDDGTTGLLFGGRVSKASPLIAIFGTVDETVAALGLARAATTDQQLRAAIIDCQRGLFVAAADLAANPHARERLTPGVSLVTPEMIGTLERTIDHLVAQHPLRPAFVVPGAALDSAALDLARTVLRRAERLIVAAREAGTPIEAHVLAYVNRASDLLYVLARWAAGEDDEPLSHE